MGDDLCFSALVRLAIMVGERGAQRYDKSVFVFTASDRSAARQRVIALGKSREDDHVNADGDRVVWRLVEIETLDRIVSDDLDGAEVYSELVEAGPEGRELRRTTSFRPEDPDPSQTGIGERTSSGR